MPIKTKESESGSCQGPRLRWGVSCMQGWRPTMEDAHIAECGGLSGPGAGDEDVWRDVAAFAVLDGHGGSQVADFVSQHFVEELVKADPENPSSSSEACLTSTFHKMDEMLRQPAAQAELRQLTKDDERVRGDISHRAGCTAVVALVTARDVVVAHAGDSRAVLCRDGEAVSITADHKPENKEERARIKQAGGCVLRSEYGTSVQHRVNGGLNVSRAIGDLEYKRGRTLRHDQQMVCSTPDVRRVARRADDEFLLLACDGIWDVLTNQEACDFVSERLKDTDKRRRLTGILEELMDKCLSPDLDETNGLGGDNMTALIVLFPREGEEDIGLAEAAVKTGPSKGKPPSKPSGFVRSPTLQGEEMPQARKPSLLARLASAICCKQT